LKSFVLLCLVAFVAVTIVMAVVFKNDRAQNTLRFLRNVGWAYVAVVVGLAALQVYREGF
jgi:ABC-type Fe3+ transport system permease subunit